MLDRFLQGHTAFDFLLLAIAVVIMPLLSARAGAELAKAGERRRLLPRYFQIIIRGWLLVALVAVVWWRLDRPLSLLGLAPHLSSLALAGFGLVAIAALFLVVQLLRLKSLPPKRLKKAMKSIDRVKVAPTTQRELAIFLLVAVTAGVWEELFYRGFLIWFLAPVVGLAGGAILSSVVFGIGHAYQGVTGVAFTALIGLVLALLYILSGSLWWLMAAHAMIDIYGGIIAWRVKQLAAQQAGR